ncbi:MAG TPA: ABC transporter substrate-binding protein [Bryobacteraceae bacterium]|nr:ABC transporter substrate-binding protein [Bryobacteraceae bacterium]
MQQILHSVTFLLAIASAGAGQESIPKPYHDPRNIPLTYNGPGRDDPDPTGLSEVRIGYFGPADGSDPEGGEMWQGANLAIEQANRTGGYRGLPLRLIPAWSQNPWAGGVANLVRITYDQKVWAIIGGIDGATTHLAEQVVAKAQLTLINPAATDRSIHAAGVPWMFSCAPGDAVLARAITEELRARTKRFAVISAIDHDSRAFEAQFQSALARDRLVPLLHSEWAGDMEDAARIAHHAVQAAPDAIIVIAPARQNAEAIRAIRDAGFEGMLLSDPRIARAAAEQFVMNVLYPAPACPSPAFLAEFRARWGRDADYTAGYAYDAVRLVVAAIRHVGLNRARIRDAVRELSPFRGVTGTIEWDAQGQNRTEVSLHILAAAGNLPAAQR